MVIKTTFLENLVEKCHNAKIKNNESCNYANSRETPWVNNTYQKLRRNLKRPIDTLLFYLATTYKASYFKTNRSYYLAVFLVCTSCIVCAMLDILASGRKRY